MIEYYHIASTIILGLLALIWTRKNWLNMWIKIGLVAIFIWGLFLVAVDQGYIVKVM